MSFGTVICCIDGRIQLPVITYLQNRFEVDYVDNVTEPGPVGVLTQYPDSRAARAILQRVDFSINVHSSSGIAIVAHHDCAGNSIPDSDQMRQLLIGLESLSKRYPQVEVIGLWLDQNWTIQEFTFS